MLQNALDFVSPQEDKLGAATNATNKPCDDKENVDPNLQQKMSFLCGKTQEKRGLIKTIKKKRKLGLTSYSRRNASPTKLLHPKTKEQRYVTI